MGRLKENPILKSIIAFLNLEDTSEVDALIKKKNDIVNDGNSGLIWLIYYLMKKKQLITLLGSNEKEEILVRQWLEHVSTHVNNISNLSPNETHSIVKEYNEALSDRTFLIGNRETIADLILYYMIHPVVSKFSLCDKERYIHVSRWMNYMQQDVKIRQSLPFLVFSRTLLYC